MFGHAEMSSGFSLYPTNMAVSSCRLLDASFSPLIPDFQSSILPRSTRGPREDFVKAKADKV
ncbi:hypothetical protein E4U42_006447 [Claviceps africana]|uniref:Uncharacterized protein n=1 Tax=Claviceps africana TaxID=83212 RepID=A0A8K0J2Z6_9HYPO|nr:hypothetical protein E4U42_006447 [Claviceps africana]